MEAIILAGGMGTRLREVVSEVPKPLAPVCGHPFLDVLFSQLQACEGISKVILAVGYKSHLIVSHCEKFTPPLPHLYSFETAPLGTGGALKKAADFASGSEILVLNGDSYLGFSWTDFRKCHEDNGADMTIACLQVEDIQRYGQVLFHPLTHQVTGFVEKGKENGKGWINGGVYLMKKELLNELPSGVPFSLEKEGMAVLSKKKVFAYLCSGAFVDIGTKESYFNAQSLLKEVACKKIS